MRLLPRLLEVIVRRGRLRLVAPDGAQHAFGTGDDREVIVRVRDASLDWRIPLNPELATAEAYIDGRLVVEDGPEGGTAHDLLALVLANRDALHATPSQRWLRGVRRLSRGIAQRNARLGARRNVAHHYDLGNDFYRLWLDADMQYSCGYFPRGDESLEAAQVAKKRHIAAKLRLEPGQRVLDIGCGWGGMALYLAAVADVEVVGITLSTEQIAAAKARAEAAGLAGQVRFEAVDYRDVDGRFDRIVSVGMLEHVGAANLDGYFARVRDCLAPGGVALIHTISAIDPPSGTGPFIRKYIFPGRYTPRLSEVAASVERAGLWPLDIEVWRVHYAKTLRAWRQRFAAERERVEALYDARFVRMWEFYLAASEIGFALATNNVLQVQLGRERDAVPLTRDYLEPAAAALAAREAEALPQIEAATRAVWDNAAAARRAG